MGISRLYSAGKGLSGDAPPTDSQTTAVAICPTNNETERAVTPNLSAGRQRRRHRSFEPFCTRAWPNRGRCRFPAPKTSIPAGMCPGGHAGLIIPHGRVRLPPLQFPTLGAATWLSFHGYSGRNCPTSASLAADLGDAPQGPVNPSWVTAKCTLKNKPLVAQG